MLTDAELDELAESMARCAQEVSGIVLDFKPDLAESVVGS